MSAISSRPRVQSVSSAVLTTAAIGGVVFAASLAASAFRFLSSAAKEACTGPSGLPQLNAAHPIKPVAALREDAGLSQKQMLAEVAKHRLPEADAIKIVTLRAIASTPYVANDPAVIENRLKVLMQSASTDEALGAQQNLFHALEESHHKVFVASLTMACSNAALKVGFGSIQTHAGVDGTVRVVASDMAGRALVTEIKADLRSEPSIETEVVNVSDGSCNEILDAFDKALEEQGVRASAPRRTFTGGVCELAAAREILRKKVKRGTSEPTGPVAGTSGSASRRGQRLNRKNRQKQR